MAGSGGKSVEGGAAGNVGNRLVGGGAGGKGGTVGCGKEYSGIRLSSAGVNFTSPTVRCELGDGAENRGRMGWIPQTSP